jgi:hypothetical protein
VDELQHSRAAADTTRLVFVQRERFGAVNVDGRLDLQAGAVPEVRKQVLPSASR